MPCGHPVTGLTCEAASPRDQPLHLSVLLNPEDSWHQEARPSGEVSSSAVTSTPSSSARHNWAWGPWVSGKRPLHKS